MSIHPEIPEWLPYVFSGVLALLVLGGVIRLVVYTLRRPTEPPAPTERRSRRPLVGWIAMTVFWLLMLILNLAIVAKGDPAWYTIVSVIVTAGAFGAGIVGVIRSSRSAPASQQHRR